MILCELPDNATANKREQIFIGNSLPVNCFYPFGNCAVHRVHRIVALARREDDAVGDCHAISFTGQQLDKRDKIHAAVQGIVSELVVIHGPPPDEVAHHMKRVLHHTVRRGYGIVRGRLVRGQDALSTRRDAASDLRMRLCRTFLNGDIRHDNLVHYEVGCCQGADGNFDMATCQSSVYAAIVEAGIASGSLSDVPSKNRWGSESEHEAEQCAGEMLFGLQRRSFAAAFSDFEVIDEDAGDESEFRKYKRGKAWRAARVTQEPDYGWRKCIMSFSLEPVDHLWLRLQHLDENGSALKDIVHGGRLDPLSELHEQFAALILQPLASGKLGCVFHHFKVRAEDPTDEMISEARRIIVSVDAQIWWWITVVLQDFPHKWIGVVDPRLSDAQIEGIYEVFYTGMGICCKTPYFDRKVVRGTSQEHTFVLNNYRKLARAKCTTSHNK